MTSGPMRQTFFVLVVKFLKINFNELLTVPLVTRHHQSGFPSQAEDSVPRNTKGQVLHMDPYLL